MSQQHPQINANNNREEINLTVVFKNHSVSQNVSASLPFRSFQTLIYKHSCIPPHRQKLFIAKAGLIKVKKLPNGTETPVSIVFPTPLARKRILLIGTPEQDYCNLEKAQQIYGKKALKNRAQRTGKRTNLLSDVLRKNQLNSANKNRNFCSTSNHGLEYSNYNNDNNNDTQFKFHQLVALPFLPSPNKSLQLLKRLSNDNGIKTVMKKYRWCVPVLAELYPFPSTQSYQQQLQPDQPRLAVNQTVTRPSLGINKNRGQIIELLLRTEEHEGQINEWIKFDDLKKMLCHELAHNMYRDHDDNFWNFCRNLEKEVAELSLFGNIGEEVELSEENDEDYGEYERSDILQYDDNHRLICDDGGYIGELFKPESISKTETELQKREGDEREGENELEKDDVKSMLRQIALDTKGVLDSQIDLDPQFVLNGQRGANDQPSNSSNDERVDLSGTSNENVNKCLDSTSENE